MGMNKRGQQIILSIMISILIFILVIILSPVLKEETSKATNTTNLNASNPNLATEKRATVILLDIGIFYFIGMIIAASIAFISGKKSITGGVTAIIVFVIVSVLIAPLKSLIILARDSSHLNCAVTETVGQKLACIAIDIWLFYFAITAIAVAISYIFATQVLPKIKGEQ